MRIVFPSSTLTLLLLAGCSDTPDLSRGGGTSRSTCGRDYGLVVDAPRSPLQLAEEGELVARAGLGRVTAETHFDVPPELTLEERFVPEEPRQACDTDRVVATVSGEVPGDYRVEAGPAAGQHAEAVVHVRDGAGLVLFAPSFHGQGEPLTALVIPAATTVPALVGVQGFTSSGEGMPLEAVRWSVDDPSVAIIEGQNDAGTLAGVAPVSVGETSLRVESAGASWSIPLTVE